ncbi:MAG: protein kinase [Sumerlaeia bacterium]
MTTQDPAPPFSTDMEENLADTRPIGAGFRAPFSPTLIPGVELSRHLGSGASASVYLGRDGETGQQVAVKILSEYYCAYPEALKRWEREAAAVEKLRHPNIVRGLRHGTTGGRPWMLMEFLQGETLANRLRRKGIIQEEEVFRIAEAVLQALKEAHKFSIIHRDIKPSNILIAQDEVLKLMDFGLAKVEDDRDLTQLGAVLGTPIYISPEQARGDLDVDIRSDFYSLGVMLYHLATAETPFSEFNTSLLLTKKITDDVPDVRYAKPDASAGLALMVHRLCARERTNRPDNPDKALELLDLVRRGEITTVNFAKAIPESGRAALRPVKPNDTDMRDSHPVFRTLLDDGTLHEPPKLLKEGTVLFYEDDTSREAYVFLHGKLEVLKAGRRIAVIEESGSWIGEMSSLLEAPRTATVRALEDSLLLEVEEEEFKTFLYKHTEMCYGLAKSLAERLEKTNQQLRDSQRRLAVIRKHFKMVAKEIEE